MKILALPGDTFVTLRVRVWIETRKLRVIFPESPVTLRVRVWIETWNCMG